MVQISSTLTKTTNLDDQLDAIRDFVTNQLSAPMFYLGLYDELEEKINFISRFENRRDFTNEKRVVDKERGLEHFGLCR